MSDDDHKDVRKRKIEEDGCDLNLGLSPPAQRPKQQEQQKQPLLQPPPGEITSLSLSPPEFCSIERRQQQAHVQGEEPEAAASGKAIPLPRAPSVFPGPFHIDSALTSPPPAPAVAAAHQSHQVIRPRPALPPAPVPVHFAGGPSAPMASPPPPPPPRDDSPMPQSRAFRPRRNPSQGPRGDKEDTIEPPFPWATNRRAVVHNKTYLLTRGIRTISGDVQCKRCEYKGSMEYDLEEKYAVVGRFIAANKHQLHDRAPTEWMIPAFPACPECKQPNCLKPVVAPKKRAINWLFLLLGQTLGCCTLEQLKYFCKHTQNHRTGAKDRVLYLTFLGICKQLEPLPLYQFDC